MGGAPPPPDTLSGIPPSSPRQNVMSKGVNTIDEILEKFFGKLGLMYYLCTMLENKIKTVCNVEGSYETLNYLNSLVESGELVDILNDVPEEVDFEISEMETFCISDDMFTDVTIYFLSEVGPPFNAMEYLYNHLFEKTNDKELVMEGEYYNYDYSEIGVFNISDDSGVTFQEGSPMISEEEYIEENGDSDFYYDDEVVPALEQLRKNIGISIYSF